MKLLLQHLILWSLGLSILLACTTKSKEPNHVPINSTHSPLLNVRSQTIQQAIPIGLQKLIAAYPEQNFKASSTALIWMDGDTMPYRDSTPNKDFEMLLNHPDLEDQFIMPYPKGINFPIPSRNSDPGRVRVEAFFLKMYGQTKEAVRKNLVEIDFLGTSLLVTQINSIDKKLIHIAKELAQYPELKKYVENVGGTFNWRKIAGTNRLSTHSFGMTIDINVKYSNYWRWAVQDKTEDGKRPIVYKNRIPLKIVQIFEENGFIWGGKWYHYDTMHFEYRPELLIE